MEEQNRHITLSELANRVKKTILDTFSGQYFWVVAEVSGHKFYADSNNHFLELVEKLEGQSVEAAKIKTNIWSESAVKIKEFEKLTGQQFKDGLQVLVKVRVNYHIVHGLSLSLIDIDASYTIGNIEKQRLETLMRLVKENPDKISQSGEEYITANKLLKMPIVIQKIALVASYNSEGLHDFMKNIRDNQFKYIFEIDSYYTSVQGAAAEDELRNALIKIFKSNKHYDVVVVIRGGGAKTDFAVFDSYGVAQTVARYPFPIITGIGHLRDISITDLMAHTVTNTPTKSAEFIVAHNRKFEDGVIQLQGSLIIKIQQFCALKNRNLSSLNTRVVNESRNRLQEKNNSLLNVKQKVVQKSKQLMYNYNNQLTFIFSKIKTSTPFVIKENSSELKRIKEGIIQGKSNLLKSGIESLEHIKSIVRLSNPKNILKKGFVLIKQNGHIKTNSSEINVGDELNLSFSDAEVVTTVKKINTGEYEL